VDLGRVDTLEADVQRPDAIQLVGVAGHFPPLVFFPTRWKEPRMSVNGIVPSLSPFSPPPAPAVN
jgi:hypothetical protein